MENWFILVLIAGSVLGTAVMVIAFKKGQDKQADYKAVAQNFGWHYVHDTATNKYAIYDTFSDPEDDWTLKIMFFSGGVHGSSSRRIEWHSPQGALPNGEAALGAPLPEKTVRMLQSGGSLGKSVAKAALKATMYALGKTKFSLILDEATAGDPGGLVMASPGQETAMDALRASSDLAAFRAARKEIDVPIIIRNEAGLTLRRMNVTSDAQELKAIVELGKALRAAL